MACISTGTGTWKTAAGTEAAIRDCVVLANNPSLLDGDTVTIDYTGTIQIEAQINITKAITITGLSCTLGTVSGVANIPTSCPTVLNNSTSGGSIFEFQAMTAAATSRVTNLKMTSDAGGAGGYGITFYGQGGGGALDGRRFRVDHVYFDGLSSDYVRPYQGAWGVVDHNYFDFTTGNGGIGIYSAAIDYPYSDARMAETPTQMDFGSNKWVYAETNVAVCTACAAAFTDGYGGARLAVRFNHLTNANIQNHGSEEGRFRGANCMQIYQNTMVSTTGSSNVIFMRSGCVMAWGNTITGYTGTKIADLVNYQMFAAGPPFGNADGTGPWHINNGGNPLATFTAAADSTNDTGISRQAVTVAGVTWTLDQWLGYSIHKPSYIPVSAYEPSGLLVTGNTAVTGGTGTLYYSYLFPGTHLDFTTGGTIELNKVTSVVDSPCRTGGTLLVARNVAITHSGATAQATLSSHNFSTDDYVSITDELSASSNYNGVYKITVTGSDTFTYLMGATPAGDALFANVTKVPAGWNDQIQGPCYQWLNTGDGADVFFSNGLYYKYTYTDNSTGANYFDYDSTKTFDGTFAANRSSIGSGTLAARPTSCTTDTFYWASDQGSWNTLGQSGLGYKCTSTDNWTLFYTPYTYPHPLIDDSEPPSSVTVHRALITI